MKIKNAYYHYRFNDYSADIGDSDDINDENNENKDEIADNFDKNDNDDNDLGLEQGSPTVSYTLPCW